MTDKKINFPDLFKAQNDKIVASSHFLWKSGWSVLHSSALKDANDIILSGHEYLLIHVDFGIVILDIMPAKRTPPDTKDKLKQVFKKSGFSALFGDLPDVHILKIHHSNILGLPSELNKLSKTNNNFLKPKEIWIEAIRIALNASFIDQTHPQNEIYRSPENASQFSFTATLPVYRQKHRIFLLKFGGTCALLAALVFNQMPEILKAPVKHILPNYVVGSEQMFSDMSSDIALVLPPIPSAMNRLLPLIVEKETYAVAAPINIPSIPRPSLVPLPTAPIIPPAPNSHQSIATSNVTSAINVAFSDQALIIFPVATVRSPVNPISVRPSNMALKSNAEKCRNIILRAQLGEVKKHDLQLLRRGC